METTPRFWDCDDAMALAETLGFTSVELLSKAQRRKGAAWMFRAIRHDDLDCCQTHFQEHEISGACVAPRWLMKCERALIATFSILNN
jgi:hypothetical protein